MHSQWKQSTGIEELLLLFNNHTHATLGLLWCHIKLLTSMTPRSVLHMVTVSFTSFPSQLTNTFNSNWRSNSGRMLISWLSKLFYKLISDLRLKTTSLFHKWISSRALWLYDSRDTVSLTASSCRCSTMADIYALLSEYVKEINDNQ